MKFPRIRFQSLGHWLLAFLPYLMVWGTVWGISMQILPSRLDRVRNNYDIGHADSAAYAWQARRMAKGEGWDIPYVTNFLYAYDPEITRYDDQWGPLLSFALTPAFYFGEDTAATAHMTTVWIGTVLLPLAMCLLVQGITLRAWPGIFGALPIWFSMELFEQSIQILNDQLVTAVLCLFLAALLGSRRQTWLLWICGPLLALAWYGKGSQLIMFPFFAIGVLLLHGPRGLIRRSFLGTLLLALLLMFPRLRENARSQGDPLHSTQNVVSSFFGIGNNGWDPGFYSVYWGRDLPGLKNRFAHPALHAVSIGQNSENFFRHLLLGLEAEEIDWRRMMGEDVAKTARHFHQGRMMPSEIIADADFTDLKFPLRAKVLIAAVLFAVLGFLTVPGDWVYILCSKQKKFPLKSQRAAAAILLAFVFSQSIFIILFWEGLVRLFYPALLVSQILIWTLLPLPFKKLKFPVWAPPVLTGLFSVAVLVHFHERLPDLQTKEASLFHRPPAEKPQYPWAKGLAKVLAEKVPADAVLMARNPWEILWYAPQSLKGVGLPYAPPEDLFAIAKYYRVTHLIRDKERRGLGSFIKHHPEAFILVTNNPMGIYEIHWDRLDPDLLTPLPDLKPMWDPRKEMVGREKRLQAVVEKRKKLRQSENQDSERRSGP